MDPYNEIGLQLGPPINFETLIPKSLVTVILFIPLTHEFCINFDILKGHALIDIKAWI